MTQKMTFVEKIIAKKAGCDFVKAGQIVDVKVDKIMANDATTHISIDMFNEKIINKTVFDPEKIFFVIDHNVPAESITTAEVQNKMRRFAKKYGLTLYDGQGVCHQLMIENHINPYEFIMGADSHTCSYGALGAFGAGFGCTDIVAAMATGKTWLMVPQSLKFNLKGTFKKGVYARDLILKIIGHIGAAGASYKAMEFVDIDNSLTIDDRIVLSNMAIEAGAKTGIFKPDEKTVKYLKEQGRDFKPDESFYSDPDALYENEFTFDLNEVEPAVVIPHNVDNYRTVDDAEDMAIKIDQAFIGSCNNGRIEELRVAAQIIKGRKVKDKVKLIVTPASQQVYQKALEEGLIETFIDSGAMVMNPNCSVCWGACQGVLGKDEVMVSTATRNFRGRAGRSDSKIYLASAATAAASALEGYIVDPRIYL